MLWQWLGWQWLGWVIRWRSEAHRTIKVLCVNIVKTDRVSKVFPGRSIRLKALQCAHVIRCGGA